MGTIYYEILNMCRNTDAIVIIYIQFCAAVKLLKFTLSVLFSLFHRKIIVLYEFSGSAFDFA